MRKFATTNNLSGIIKKTSLEPGAVIITKVSEAEAAALAAIPTYFSVNVDPNPGVNNTFKIAFNTTPVRSRYVYGTLATITADTGYTITSVLANGEAITPVEGVYTHRVVEAVDIDISTLALFTVTLDPATGNFTAEYSTTAIGGKYTDGTVVTIAATEGYEITALTLNGEAVAGTEGVYSIEITANSTIAITSTLIEV